MIDNINELAAEAHENAVAHGFYGVPNPEECNIAMLHCELSEAVQAERAEWPMIYRMCTACEHGPCLDKPGEVPGCGFYFPDGKKPEGIAVELADFVIRLMDYAAGHGMKIPTRQQLVPTYSSLPRLVNRLHSSINELVHFRKISEDFGLQDDAGNIAQACIVAYAVELVETYLDEQDVELWEVVREKMDYNRSRPMLHGKKY